MKIPLSWLKEFVDIDLTLVELARLLTMLGLEVDEIHVVGLPNPYEAPPAAGRDNAEKPSPNAHEFKVTGLSWEPDKIVVAKIREVLPHPNADRLVLCNLYDGMQEHVVLTGAPNLFPYKGQGVLDQPLKVAYAKEGARIYDGHQPGLVETTLKRAKIRGVDSYSMVASEKELGISEEHEGVIVLDADAPTGMSLVDYMGDAVFEISILPNMARNANVLGVAREVAAATGKPLRKPISDLHATGQEIAGKVDIEIEVPELNPRFVVGLIQGVSIAPSPYWVQLRLRLAGMRPINNIVDATNYVMLETGQPLHAFDYDALVRRAGGSAPTIITRTAHPGERLQTLDMVDRPLDPFTVLVTDRFGALSIAGVMGGAETEVTQDTRNILLEGAAWNFINIRRTVKSQGFNSEAAYRFSRGVHPQVAELGVVQGLSRMQEWGGGEIARGMVDAYPLPPQDPEVTLSPADVTRLLGIQLSAEKIAGLLERLEFTCRVESQDGQSVVHAKTPPHRMDIGEGVTGVADLIEEVARLYGYERIPETRMADELPPQRSNLTLEAEEHIRDLLVSLGLQEVLTYRMTTREREARQMLWDEPIAEDYLHLVNPISPERVVMRRSLLASMLEVVERNARLSERLALFEIGEVYIPNPAELLPDEPRHLVIVLRGKGDLPTWDKPDSGYLDFYDLKGVVEALFDGLHISGVQYEPVKHPSLHPGKSAQVRVGDRTLGVIGELDPRIRRRLDLEDVPVQAADFDVNALLAHIPTRYNITPVPVFPPVFEDIAIILDEGVPADKVEATIHQAGGKLLESVHLFDIYHGDQIGVGKKSMAYSLVYQAPDRTLTDGEVAQVRNRIVKRLEQELEAKLRA